VRIYFSGMHAPADKPETLIPERRPAVMLTFFELQSVAKEGCKRGKQNKTRERFRALLSQ